MFLRESFIGFKLLFKKKTKPNLHHIFTTFDSFDVIKMRDPPSPFIWVFFPTSNLISLISMTSQESKVVQNGAQSNASSKKNLSKLFSIQKLKLCL